MSVVSIASLLVKETTEKILATGLSIAARVGLPVSSWQPGDPTRSLFMFEAEFLEKWEDIVVGFIGSSTFEFAQGVWVKIHAKQGFNFDVPEATYAATKVVLTNSTGRFYPDIEPGDLVFKSSINGKTYTNTTGGTLASGAGEQLVVSVQADEPGSLSSAGAGEIDDMVTTLLGVTCTNPTAAIGLDEPGKAAIVEQCNAKIDARSPNGPKGAYEYVARNPDLTGTRNVTRARSYSDSDMGDVLLYIAGPSGAVSEDDRLKVEKAVAENSTPLCVTPTVAIATDVPIDVTYELWAYASVNRTTDEIGADVTVSLQQKLAERNIGGDIIPPAESGAIYKSLIEEAIGSTYPQVFRVRVTSPPSDVPLARGEVAALGAVTATIHIVPGG